MSNGESRHLLPTTSVSRIGSLRGTPPRFERPSASTGPHMRLTLLLSGTLAFAAPEARWANLPLSVEPNMGQTASQVRYLARASGYTLCLSPIEIVLAKQNQRPRRTKLAGRCRGAKPVLRLLCLVRYVDRSRISSLRLCQNLGTRVALHRARSL
jgi:hypothetical protein